MTTETEEPHRCELKYICKIKDKTGTVRRYFRAKRRIYGVLPGDPDSEEYKTEYQRLRAALHRGELTGGRPRKEPAPIPALVPAPAKVAFLPGSIGWFIE